jgi:hypothetical protein
MQLLERDTELERLDAALAEAAAGQGRVALIAGEAGIGKTTFISRFLSLRGKNARVLIGNCDSLFTPSPLGPLYDIARNLGGRLLAQLESEAPRAQLFSTMLDLLREGERPTIVVFEDVHWADEATIDLLKYLGRRIDQTHALIILTYRNDEIGSRHLLRPLLGDLATSPAAVRINLPRLTLAAVRQLIADRAFDAESLHRQTSGNPFFITEILSSDGHGVPRTVSDSVLARVARLEGEARHAIETAAVLASRMELALLEIIVGGDGAGIAQCLQSGLLELTENTVAFRHELVRDAILGDLDAGRRRELCRAALKVLTSSTTRQSDLAQLAHFAEGAGDSAALLIYGPAAAKEAAAAGAHRAAAAHYRRSLAVAQSSPHAEHASLLEAYARQCAIIDEQAEAVKA